MPEADVFDIASRRAIRDLPSILDLARHANAAATNDDPPPSENADEEAKGALIWDREAALRDLLLTFRAKTLGDATAQLYAAYIAADDLLGLELESRDRDRFATNIRRALLSAIPIVAEAAGLDLAEIGAEYIPDYTTREFPEEA
jgi:hypothetical protein